MPTELHLLALAARVLLPAAAVAEPAAGATQIGYFNRAGAAGDDTGDATLAKQQASGHFPGDDAPLVSPSQTSH